MQLTGVFRSVLDKIKSTPEQQIDIDQVIERSKEYKHQNMTEGDTQFN